MALVIFATLVALATISETTARLLFRESATSTMKCLVATDAHTGVRGIAGSSCRQKAFESPLIDYRFNDCGFRTPQPCRAAPAEVYRVLLLGSSMSYGMHVAEADGMAARLGPLLSRRTGRPIDVFNESMQWGVPSSVALRTDAMMRPHPDLIVWALTPFDIQNARLILPFIPGKQDELSAPVPNQQGTGEVAPPPAPDHGLATIPGRALRRVTGALSDTRTVFMLRHYLYRSPSQYLLHVLSEPDATDYLQPRVGPALRSNLDVFADAYQRVAARAAKSHVPLVVTLLPSRAQAIMLTGGDTNHDHQPRKLAFEIAKIVGSRGGQFVDMSRGIERYPDAGSRYLPVDEHPTPAGQAMMAELMSDALLRSHLVQGAAR